MWTQNYRTVGRGAWETTRSMKYFLQRQKDWSSILRSHIKSAKCGKILALRKQRQVNFRSSTACQPGLFGNHQTS